MIRIWAEADVSEATRGDRRGLQHIADLLPTVLAQYLPHDARQLVRAEYLPSGSAPLGGLEASRVAGFCPEVVHS